MRARCVSTPAQERVERLVQGLGARGQRIRAVAAPLQFRDRASGILASRQLSIIVEKVYTYVGLSEFASS